MPYFVYKLEQRPLRLAEPLGEFAGYAEASRFAKAKRAELAAEGCAVRMVFAESRLQAEDALLNPQAAPPRHGDED
jgi:hypothetical protein